MRRIFILGCLIFISVACFFEVANAQEQEGFSLGDIAQGVEALAAESAAGGNKGKNNENEAAMVAVQLDGAEAAAMEAFMAAAMNGEVNGTLAIGNNKNNQRSGEGTNGARTLALSPEALTPECVKMHKTLKEMDIKVIAFENLGCQAETNCSTKTPVIGMCNRADLVSAVLINKAICTKWNSLDSCSLVKQCKARKMLNSRCIEDSGANEKKIKKRLKPKDIADISAEDTAEAVKGFKSQDKLTRKNSAIVAIAKTSKKVDGKRKHNKLDLKKNKEENKGRMAANSRSPKALKQMLDGIDLEKNIDVLNEIGESLEGGKRAMASEILKKAGADTTKLKRISRVLKANIPPKNMQEEMKIMSQEEIFESLKAMGGGDEKVTNENRYRGHMVDIMSSEFMGYVNEGNKLVASDVSQIPAEFFSKLNESDIDKISEANKKAVETVCRKIAHNKFWSCSASKSKRLKVTKKCLKILLGEEATPESIHRLRDQIDIYTGELVFQEVRQREIAVSDLDDEFICQNINFAGKPHIYPTRGVLEELTEAFANCLLKLYNIRSLNFTNYECVWLLQLQKAEAFSEEDKNYIRDILMFNSTCLVEVPSELEEDEELTSCEVLDSTNAERIESDLALEETRTLHTEIVLASVGVTHLIEQEIESSEVSRKRKKRATSSMECSTLQTFIPEEMKQHLSVEIINAMDQTEFSDCMTYLSEIDGWTAEQYQSLLQKAMSVIGISDMCSVDSATASFLGSFVQGLSSADIMCNTAISESIAYFGAYSDWSQSQLSSIVEKYMEEAQITGAEYLTFTDLIYLQHAVCGLDEGAIKLINPDEYMLATSTLNVMKKASYNCLIALGDVAKNEQAYGPVSTWTSLEFDAIGILLGGLTSDELNLANADSVEVWGSNIAHISPEIFQALTVETLKKIVRENIGHVTTQQRALLSSQQLDALEEAVLAETIPPEYSGQEDLDASTAMSNINHVVFVDDSSSAYKVISEMCITFFCVFFLLLLKKSISE